MLLRSGRPADLRRYGLGPMEPTTHLEHLRADLDLILDTPPEQMDAPVDACPGWTVATLLTHHAGVFRFATAQLRAEPGSNLARFDPPDDDLAPLEMLSTTGDELLAVMADTDPAEHRPNWADAPTAAFWFRRMAQETAIHRVDVQLTHLVPDPIDAALAMDGIDELAEVFLAHAGRRGITGTGETVHLHATDDEVAAGALAGEWMFTFHESGVDVAHEHGKGDMAVRAPAGQLLLFAWNRRPVEVQCFGDPDPLRFWARTVRI